MSFKGLTLGVPREVMHGERRVAVSPVTARKMIEAGARVLVETGAGLGSHFPDDEYRAAGAEVLGGVEDLFARSQVILKVKELQYREGLGKHEVDMMRPGQYVIAFLHPAAPDNHQLIERIAANESVTAGQESVSLRFCVANALARVKYPAGPDILDLEIKASWENGIITLSPRVVKRRQLPSSFDEL